jgi:hypothetical protein
MIFRGGLFFFLLIFFSSLEHLNTFLATNITFTSVILAPFYAGYNPCQSNTISRIKINSLVIPVTDIYPGPFLTFQGPNAKFDIETHPHTNIYNYINNIKYLTYRKYYTLF